MKKPTGKRIVKILSLLFLLLCLVAATLVGFWAYQQQRAIEAIEQLLVETGSYRIGTSTLSHVQNVVSSLTKKEQEELGPELLAARIDEYQEGGKVLYFHEGIRYEPAAPDWLRRFIGHRRCLLWFDRPLEVDFLYFDNRAFILLQNLPSIERLYIDQFITFRDDNLESQSGRSLYPLDDGDISRLRTMTNLRELWLNSCSITDTGLEQLATLHKLDSLSLDGTPLSDESFRHLVSFSQLKELSPWGKSFTNAGLEHVKELQHLEMLDLSYTGVTDEGMIHLESLLELRTLNLCETEIGNDGLVQLSRLPRLERLNLAGTGIAITETQPERLDVFRNLIGLDLSDTIVTDGGVQRLVNATPNLRILILDRTAVSDAVLPHIEWLQELKNLSLSQTGVTEKGKRRFYAIKPHLKDDWSTRFDQ